MLINFIFYFIGKNKENEDNFSEYTKEDFNVENIDFNESSKRSYESSDNLNIFKNKTENNLIKSNNLVEKKFCNKKTITKKDKILKKYKTVNLQKNNKLHQNIDKISNNLNKNSHKILHETKISIITKDDNNKNKSNQTNISKIINSSHKLNESFLSNNSHKKNSENIKKGKKAIKKSHTKLSNLSVYTHDKLLNYNHKSNKNLNYINEDIKHMESSHIFKEKKLTSKNLGNKNTKNLFEVNYKQNLKNSSDNKLITNRRQAFLSPFLVKNNINENTKDFLKILDDEITYDAFLHKNKEVLQDQIKDFLGDMEGSSRYKMLFTRLKKVEKSFKELFYLKKIVLTPEYNKKISSVKFNLKVK